MGTLTAFGGTLTSVGGALSGVGPAPEPEPALAFSDFSYLRGVNAAGGEFDHTASGLPGTHGGNYRFSSRAYYDYLRGRGHRIVRVPFRWERVQPVLSGPLEPAGLDPLKTTVQAAIDAGLFVLLDMHNYGRFWRLDDVEVMFGDGITAADYQDVWAKLAAEFPQPQIMHGLMNEPRPGMPPNPGYFTPADPFLGYTFDTDTAGWSISGGAGTLTIGSFPNMTGAGAMQVSRVLPASTTTYSAAMRINESTGAGATIRNASLTSGQVIEWELYVPESTPGMVRVRPEIVDPAFTPVTGAYTTLTKGVTQRIYQPVPEALTGTNHRNVILQVEVLGSDGVTPTVIFFGNIAVGTTTGDPSVWKAVSQAAVTAIRGTGDTRPIAVAGHAWGGAEGWPGKNGDPWIVDPADNTLYEAHYYCSQGYNASTFTTYADAVADATARGWASLAARVTDELGDFTEWLTTHGARGFIGEIGWPKGADVDQWNAVGEVMYDLLDAAGVGATQWTAGEAWSLGQPMNLYEGQGSDVTVGGQAVVLEAHPSPPAA